MVSECDLLRACFIFPSVGHRHWLVWGAAHFSNRERMIKEMDLFQHGKPGPQGQVRDDRLCLRSTLFFGFSPPWCEMTVFCCSLYKILTMSYRLDSYKVRSGPGVSGVQPSLCRAMAWQAGVRKISNHGCPKYSKISMFVIRYSLHPG